MTTSHELFEQAYARHKAGPGHYEDFLDEIKLIPQVEFDINRRLQQEWRARDYELVQALVVAALSHPAQQYEPIACEILDAFDLEVNNEDLVDLLDEIGTDRAVDVIIRTLDREVPGDHAHWLNVKCLDVLWKIGGDRALAAVDSARFSPIFDVRRSATFKLFEK